jgi:P-type Mg2+ transporter
VLTGREIESLDDEQLAAAIPGTTVFARVGPDQKSRIIKVARRAGKDVAFLGDGSTTPWRCITPTWAYR